MIHHPVNARLQQRRRLVIKRILLGLVSDFVLASGFVAAIVLIAILTNLLVGNTPQKTMKIYTQNLPEIGR